MSERRTALSDAKVEEFRQWGQRLVDGGPEVVAGSQQAAAGYAMLALCEELSTLRARGKENTEVEDIGFEHLVADPVVEVEHDNYSGVRHHVLTLHSGVEVSVVTLARVLRLLKDRSGASHGW